MENEVWRLLQWECKVLGVRLEQPKREKWKLKLGFCREERENLFVRGENEREEEEKVP